MAVRRSPAALGALPYARSVRHLWDSGGPWYLGHTAYGITMGGFSTDNDAVYTAIDYIAAFGVSVLTFDPQGVACQCSASVRV
jgi:hypothetical protein